jgi:hypothetical protein
MRCLAAVLVAASLALPGCPTRDLTEQEIEVESEGWAEIPVEVNRDLDILFVIDDSGSMAEEQASLAANFDRFIGVLENLEGGLPNIHLGVVSTDLGAGGWAIAGCEGDGGGGRLQSAARGDCAPPDGAFIRDIALADGTRDRNYAGSLAETFSCIAQLGTAGCGFEQPLEAMRRALDGSVPGNAGFLRPDAFLLVVFITDEDDCSTADPAMFDTGQTAVDDPLGPLSSFRCFEFGVACDPDTPRAPGARTDCRPRAGSPYMHDVDAYAEFLLGLKDDPRMVIVAGIVGDPAPVAVGVDALGRPRLEPSCSSASGEADPAVRLAHLLSRFPARNTLTTICNEDLSDALALIAGSYRLPDPCIWFDIDLDPGTPGVQHECVVSDVRGDEETLLSACDALPPAPGTLPCWHLEEQEACAASPHGLALRVERGPVTVPAGLRSVMRCRLP